MSKIIKKELPEQLVAGVSPSDSNIEFVGVKSTKTVLWLQNGHTKYFKDIPSKYFKLLKEAYLKDETAVSDLAHHKDIFREVELFTYYLYGDLDNTADIIDGVLSPSENFRDSKHCMCARWESKKIRIDNEELTPRDISILDAISEDLPDKAIAELLGISISTFNWHKQNLLNKTNCTTKVALAIKAENQKVLIA